MVDPARSTAADPQPIKEILDARGISPTEFSEGVGFPIGYVERVNGGEEAPSPEYIVACKRLLEMHPAALFRWDANIREAYRRLDRKLRAEWLRSWSSWR